MEGMQVVQGRTAVLTFLVVVLSVLPCVVVVIGLVNTPDPNNHACALWGKSYDDASKRLDKAVGSSELTMAFCECKAVVTQK